MVERVRMVGERGKEKGVLTSLLWGGGSQRSFGKGGLSLFLGVRGRMAAGDHSYDWENNFKDHFFIAFWQIELW